MSSRIEAIAALAKRQIIGKFNSDDLSPMVRVTCLEREEIVALVESLRSWLPPGPKRDVRIVVTAQSVWPELRPDDLVPREDETPTTLRNLRDVAVILVEGDQYSDRQSWSSVRPISDSGLLSDQTAREELLRHFMASAPPTLLSAVLEEVHAGVRAGNEDQVNVRRWIAFVDVVCTTLGAEKIVDAPATWSAVGEALTELKLFPDDLLPRLSVTDRRRRLRRNLADSHRLLFEADDQWRDNLQERAQEIVFVDPNGEPEPDSDAIRSSIRRLLGPDGGREQHEIAFRHWLQVTDKNTERKGLGTRISEHLAQHSAERAKEYDGLGVAAGLDSGTSDDARRLLEAQPTAGADIPLVSLLTPKQVSALERMANPRAPATTSPLSEILRVVDEMMTDRAALTEAADASEPVKLILQTRKSRPESEHSRGLFAWLFGNALVNVVTSVADEPISLKVHDELLDMSSLSSFERVKAPEEDEDDNGHFRTLELRLRWSDGAGLERSVDWDPSDTPGLVAFWRLTARGEVTKWAEGPDVSFDAWLAGALQRTPMLGGLPREDEPHEVASTWAELRAEFLSELHRTGLCPSSLSDYVDGYQQKLLEIREHHVPAGAARPEVAAVLEQDLYIGDAGAILLASHPIRLRWIAKYLAIMEQLLTSALRGELFTNPVNSGLFFAELLSASPQAQPPVAVVGDQLYVAVREQDWHERFAPLKDERGERRDWLADLDDGAIDDVGESIGRYLDAYPHKADGLHVLYIVRRHGARGLHRLVGNVLRRIKVPTASLDLTLFVDRAEIRDVEELLQEFDNADHRAYSDRPPLQVTLHPWEKPEESLPDVSGVLPMVDVAVIPNLFGASTRTHDGTRDGRLDTGKFDPLLDESTRLEAVGGGEALSAAVSRVLLPEGRDDLLEAWSTVNTRQFRGTPVSETPNDHDIDHVTIQVSLDKNREFFDALHDCSHWVVTVDAFVGREQIEALENGPDVIRVKTGVGANGAYRMVVSSSFGRQFVESRIARRLLEQLPESALPDPEALAKSIYDRARLLVPGIVLRSLGLGRTAAEMVGLVLARARVEQVHPAKVGPHGFQSWLSLDEHPEWSGGHQSARADLARIRGRLEGKTLHLIVDVVEAKMRSQVAVGRADRQISRSVDLLRAALGHPASDDAVYADAPMWQRLLWRAIEQTSSVSDATPAATHTLTPDGPRAGLDEHLRAALRQGDIVVEAVNGVLVSMTESTEASDSNTAAGHEWLTLTLDETKAELLRLCDQPEYPLRGYEVDSPPPTDDEAMIVDDTNEAPPDAKPSIDTPDERVAPATRGGRTEAALGRMQDLLDALHARDVVARPAGGEDDALEGPGFYLLRIHLGSGVRPQAVLSLTDDLQYHLRLEAAQVPRIYVDRGAVVVEVPKREEERYYVAARDLWSRTEWPNDRLYAPLGCDVRDEPVGIDFSSSRSPHLLIGGMTGGGKSVALETLLWGLIRQYPPERLELRIVDPKGNEFIQFEGLPHVPELPGMDAEDAIEMLTATCDEMDARYLAMKTLSRSSKTRIRDIASYNELVGVEERFKWIVVVLDEFADLTADKDNKKKIEALLQRIAQKARACGIHAIVATQKPSAEVISTTTRSNLGAQLALRVRSGTDSRVIMEATGAESLAGNGDAFLRLSGEDPIRIQCAKVE